MKPELIPPEEFFGFQLGADRKIARWDQIAAYYDHLQDQSDRIQVKVMGPTTEGNPFLLVIISSPDNLSHLEELRQTNLKLADPEGLDDTEVAALIQKGKAVICQSMSLHANEIGGTQMAPELAFDLLRRDDEEALRILENVIFLLVPCFNPDGEIMVADWYRRWLGTEYEGCELPWLYHPYAGHDNNRDSFQANLVESRYVNQILFVDWLPQAYLDHHHFGSYGARFYVPPYCEPIHPFADPLVWREHSWYGGHIAYKLEEAGKQGVLNAAQFPAWGHLGFHRIAMYHNIAGMLTESASVNLATPIQIQPELLSGDDRGWLRHYAPQLNFPNPWPGGWWRLRDVVEQQKICAWAALDMAARNKETVLRNAFLKARHQTENGTAASPNAYLVSPDQHDPLTMQKMIGKLLGQGIKVFIARQAVQLPDRTIAPGSYLIWLDQPKSGLITTLFERTFYPDNPWTRTAAGEPIVPWDMVTDTMPEFMGVRVESVAIDRDGSFERISAPCLPDGGVSRTNSGSLLGIDPCQNASYALVNELLKLGVKIFRSTDAVRIGDKLAPPGAFLFKDEPGLGIDRLARRYHLPAAACSSDPQALQALTPLRVGIFQRYWGGNADEGWTRLVLEEFNFAYQTVHLDDIRSGSLSDRFDVLVIPNDQTALITGENIEQWWDKQIAKKPLVPYPPEFQQTMGAEGLEALKEFVANGGRLVALGVACDFAIDKLGLNLANCIKDIDSKAYYCPGSTLKAFIDNRHPLGYGLPDQTYLVAMGNVAFDLPEGGAGQSVARYADEDVLQSGWLIGEEMIRSKSAAATVPYGSGEVVLLGCRVQNRAQTDGAYKLLFNSLYRVDPLQ